MMIIPRQYDRYMLTNTVIWVCRMLCSVASLLYIIGSLNMFENIPDIKLVIAISALAVIAWIGSVQYSKYIDHRKANKDVDEEKYGAKFAVIPYFVIPVAFAVLSVILALFVAQYAVIKGYVQTEEYICLTAVVSAVIINCILDKFLVSHVGDAVYFQTIEDKVAKVAEEFPGVPDISEEDMKLLELLKVLKK